MLHSAINKRNEHGHTLHKMIFKGLFNPPFQLGLESPSQDPKEVLGGGTDRPREQDVSESPSFNLLFFDDRLHLTTAFIKYLEIYHCGGTHHIQQLSRKMNRCSGDQCGEQAEEYVGHEQAAAGFDHIASVSLEIGK